MSLFIIGDKAAEEHFVQLGARAVHAEPAMAEIGVLLSEIAGISMTAQGRRGGGSWAALKPATIIRKVKGGLDPRTEFATQALYRSLVESPNIEIDNKSIKFGSSEPYAKAQHFGDPSHNLPARPLITIVEGDRKKIDRILLRYIVGTL